MGGKVGNIVKAAVVGAAIATGVGVALGTIAFTTAAVGSAFMTAFVTQAVLGAVATALSPKPEQYTSANELRGRTVMTKQAISPRDVVYGEVKKSGTIVFLETTNNNKDLHLCVTVAGHEINAVKDVFFNDVKVREADLSDGVEVSADSGTSPNYSSTASITAHFGASDQAADTNLVSRTSFTSDHRLRGIAYLYSKMIYDQDVYANGLPNVSAVIQGKKVYDPRTDTTAYSNNAALCIRDYVSNSTYGLGATDDEIDDVSFNAAANICDEDVTLVAGGTEKRYTINGVVDTSKSPREILNDMLSACGGTIFYSNGKWKLKVGAYVTPTTTITNDDLRGSITIQTRNSGRDQFNAIKGIFVSPENNWQPTDFPELTSGTFEAEDGGDRKYLDLVLAYTTSAATSQRLAKQILYRNREQIVVTLPCKMTAFQYEVGDTLQVTNERFGWTNKVFEVVSWNFAFDNEQLGVDLTLKETSSGIYSWDSAVDEAEFTFNNTSLPDAFDVVAPGISVDDELRVLNQEAVSVLIVDITSGDTFASRFEVEAKKTTDTEYVNLGQAAGNRFELLNVEDGATYDVRARVINTLGVRSAFTATTHQVIGKTAPPQNVTNFTGNVVGGQLVLTWTPVSDLDLSHYRLRYSALTTGATYQNAVNLSDKIARPGTLSIVPARTGTYFIKAIDKLGLASESPATIVVTTNIDGVENLNLVDTVTEGPEFDGTFDDTVELDAENQLILDTSINFDSAAGNFDDATGLFDGGGGNVDLEGFYYFANSSDLGAVYTSRLTASITSTRTDYVNTFDDATGLFDEREGTFDGDVNAFDNTDVELQLRTTSDDPTGSPTWSGWTAFVVGDYTARAFEFRLRLTTTDTQATPVVSGTSVTIDMPDRVLSGEDISSGAGAYAVTFSPAFKAIPAIGIAAQNLATGDYYEITSKSASGFTITFKNSSGTAVDRTFDYVAKGYGRIET